MRSVRPIGVFETLVADHGEATLMLDRLVLDPDLRVELWPQLREALLAHERAEAETLSGQLRIDAGTRALVVLHDASAQDLDTLIHRIDTTSMECASWGHLFDQLDAMVRGHILDEEAVLFPLAQRALGAQRAYELDAEFRAVRQRIQASLVRL